MSSGFPKRIHGSDVAVVGAKLRPNVDVGLINLFKGRLYGALSFRQRDVEKYFSGNFKVFGYGRYGTAFTTYTAIC